MPFVRRLLLIVLFGSIAYLTYKLNEKAIDKGNYVRSWGNGKITLWSLPFYFSFIACAAMIFFTFLD